MTKAKRKAPAKRKAQPLARPAAKRTTRKATLETGVALAQLARKLAGKKPLSNDLVSAVIAAPKLKAASIHPRLTAPLAKFRIAPENPRQVRPKPDVEKLSRNLAANGIASAVICYAEKGLFHITAGGTRYEAAKLAKIAELPYDLREKDEAITLGLAEQEGHTPLHAADQAEGYAREIARGKTPTDVANALGVTPRFVEQRLALARLHKPILQALRSGKIDLPAAAAWANVSPERQQLLWGGARNDVHHIKELVDKGDVPTHDRLAKFVGEKAYRDAGGVIRQELFSVGQYDEYGQNGPDVIDDPKACEGFLTDRKILDRLVKEKLEEAKAKAIADGWGFVETTARPLNSPPHEFAASKTPATTKAAKAKLGVFICIDYEGKLKAFANLTRVKRDGGDVGGAKRTVAKAEESFDYKLRDQMTQAAAGALATALANNIDAALVVLLATLARAAMSELGDAYGGALGCEFFGRNMRAAAGDPLGKLRKTFLAELKPHKDRLEDHIAKMSDKKRGALFAFCVASIVDIESANDMKAVAAAVKLSGLKLGEVWTPSAEQLKAFPPKAFAEACDELDAPASGFKIEEMVAAARQKKWTPRIVRERLGEPPGKAVKGKRGGKAPADASESSTVTPAAGSGAPIWERWLSERVVRAAGAFVPTKAAYDDYVTYSASPSPLKTNAFIAAMTKSGVQLRTVDGARAFAGIALLSSSAAAEA